jgi:hypothetical protein
MSDATTEAPLPMGEAIAPIEQQTEVTIRFDDQAMATNYANVASVASTADEILLLFGTNKGWAVPGAEVSVALSNRIILTQSVARGLLDTLTRVLAARTGA